MFERAERAEVESSWEAPIHESEASRMGLDGKGNGARAQGDTLLDSPFSGRECSAGD